MSAGGLLSFQAFSGVFPAHELAALVHGPLHGVEDVLIAGAAAQVAGNELAQLVPGVGLSRAHDLHGGQDDARRTEAALDGGLLHEGPLDGAERAGVRVLEPLHREDALSLRPDGQVDARVDGRAVHQDGAGAALPHLTALFHAGEPQPLPQGVGQGFPRVDAHLHVLAVDGHMQNLHHICAPPFLAASASARPESSDTNWMRNSRDARQLVRGLTSARARAPILSTASDKAIPFTPFSAVKARMGTGPATPKARRASSTVRLSADSFTRQDTPKVAMSMALRWAYLM